MINGNTSPYEWKKWKEKLAKAQSSFEESQRSSKNLAHMFGDFCGFSSGVVLDVGCGPKKGEYLHSANLEALVGLDPLHAKPVGMEFVRGVGENLPFRSNAFNQTVCSTMLDHCLNPVAVLREIRRVTKGKINLWTGIDRRPRDKGLFRKAHTLIAAWQFRRILRGVVTRSTNSIRRVIGLIKHSLGFELDPVQFYDLIRSRYHLHYFTEQDLLRILAESTLEIREKKVIDESMFLSVI